MLRGRYCRIAIISTLSTADGLDEPTNEIPFAEDNLAENKEDINDEQQAQGQSRRAFPPPPTKESQSSLNNNRETNVNKKSFTRNDVILCDGDKPIYSYVPPSDLRLVAICGDYTFLYTLQEAILPHFTSYAPICNNLAHCPLEVEINVSRSGFQMEQKRNTQSAKILQSPPEELDIERNWLNKMQRSFDILIVQINSSCDSTQGGFMSRAELINTSENLV